jgi:hypothetical protein
VSRQGGGEGGREILTCSQEVKRIVYNIETMKTAY